MPPCPVHLKTWFDGPGKQTILDLIDYEKLKQQPGDPGFNEACQIALMAYDNDDSLLARILVDLPEIERRQRFNYHDHPRTNLHQATEKVFSVAGIDLTTALDALGHLDAFEVQRRQLVNAAIAVIREDYSQTGHAAYIGELNAICKERYNECYLGFRAHVLLKVVAPGPLASGNIIEVMKYLNALFPPFKFEGDFEASGMPPYTSSLRNSLRLAVFHHVMSEHPFSTAMQKKIYDGVLQWTDFQKYDTCRKTLSRYNTDARKLEQACFQVMNAHEKRKKAASVEFFVPISSAQTPGGPQNPEAGPSDSSVGRPALFQGMPGRELVGGVVNTHALVDGSGVYPLSETTEARSPTGDDEEDLHQRHGVPPSAPKNKGKGRSTRASSKSNSRKLTLETIPESSTTSSGSSSWREHLKKLFRPGSDQESSAAQPSPSTNPEKSSTESHTPNRELLSPSDTRTDNVQEPSVAGPSSSVRKYQEHGYTLAPPAMGPMEYARYYLIELAKAKKEGKPFALPLLEKEWYWTSDCGQFFIFPKLPFPIKKVFRDGAQEPETPGSSNDDDDAKYHRLSLNMGCGTSFMEEWAKANSYIFEQESTTLVNEGSSGNDSLKQRSPPQGLTQITSIEEVEDDKSSEPSARGSKESSKSSDFGDTTDYEKYPELRPLLDRLENLAPLPILTNDSSDEISSSTESVKETTAQEQAPKEQLPRAPIQTHESTLLQLIGEPRGRDPETSSIYSQDSVKTVIPAGVQAQESASPEDAHMPSLFVGRRRPFEGHPPARMQEASVAPLPSTTPTSSPSSQDRTLGNSSSPDAPASSPLAAKSKLNIAAPGPWKASAAHARARHEPLIGSGSPAKSSTPPQKVLGREDTAQVAPLRLHERPIKRRSSIPEGVAFETLKAQLAKLSEVPFPEVEHLTYVDPDDSARPAPLRPSAPRVPNHATGSSWGSSSHGPPSPSPRGFSQGKIRPSGSSRRPDHSPTIPGFEPHPQPAAHILAMDLAGGRQYGEATSQSSKCHGHRDPFPHHRLAPSTDLMSEKARGKQPEYALTSSSGSSTQPLSEKARGKLPATSHSTRGSESSNEPMSQKKPTKLNLYAHHPYPSLDFSHKQTVAEQLRGRQPSHAFSQASINKTTHSSTSDDGSKSVFYMEKARARDATVLPKIAAPQNPPPVQGDVGSPMSPSGRPKHIPIVPDPNKYLESPPQPVRRLHTPIVIEGYPAPNLKFDPAEEMKRLAQAAERAGDTSEGKDAEEQEPPRSAGSAIANFFRRPFKGTLPKTPTTPSKPWNPFEDNAPQPPSKSTWVEGQQDDGGERDARKAFFKAKAGDPSSTTIASSSQASGTVERAVYPVETYPWPVVRDRSRSRPRVSAETFAKNVQQKASRKGMSSRANEPAEDTPPVPPLPSTYRATRPSNLALDLASTRPTEAIEAAALSGTIGRLRRQKSEEPSRAAGESSLRAAFKLGPKKSGEQK